MSACVIPLYVNTDVAPVPCERVKAVTLDEIEAPLTRHDDDDASAYRKLVSVLWSSGAMHDEVATPEVRRLVLFVIRCNDLWWSLALAAWVALSWLLPWPCSYCTSQQKWTSTRKNAVSWQQR